MSQYIFVVISLVLAYFVVKWLIFILGYNRNGGFIEEVFTSPVPYSYAMFYCGYLIFSLIGSLLMIKRKKIGWIITYIALFWSFLILILIISISIFINPVIFDLLYIFAFIIVILLLLFLNSNFMLQQVGVTKSFVLYAIIVGGVIIISLIAASSFGLTSYN